MGRHFSAILVLFATPLFGYPTPVDFSGQISRWDISLDNPTVTYTIRADSTYDEAYFGNITDDAATVWNQVPSAYIELVPAPANEQAQITIEFTDTINDGGFSSGYAIFDEFDENNKPLHCRVVVLNTLRVLTLQKTILHELGHCLGLGHTLVPEAIMSYSLDKNRYGLDTDDRAALSRIYPADGSEPQLPPGCSTPSWLGRKKMLHWLLLLLFLPPLLAVFINRHHVGAKRLKDPGRLSS